MNPNIPEEIVSHILSFRPRHPLAQILLDFKERAVAEAVTDYYHGDQSIFDESLHKLISYTQEGDQLFWKNTLGDGDPDQYCWRVRRDYDAVYDGDWNYGCTRWLGLYEDPTQRLRINYSPEAQADLVQRKIEWAINHRRLTGNDPKVYK